MALRTELTARLRGFLTGSLDLSAPSAIPDLNVALTLESGTAASKADLVFSDTRTIAASGSETLDLAGTLKDDLGNTIVFVKVKAILIRARSTNTNDVVIGAAASNPFLGPLSGTAPKITLPPGGLALLAAPVNGWTSADGAADSLKIANSGAGTGVDYDIVIVGTSA